MRHNQSCDISGDRRRERATPSANVAQHPPRGNLSLLLAERHCGNRCDAEEACETITQRAKQFTSQMIRCFPRFKRSGRGGRPQPIGGEEQSKQTCRVPSFNWLLLHHQCRTIKGKTNKQKKGSFSLLEAHRRPRRSNISCPARGVSGRGRRINDVGGNRKS